MLVIAFLGSLLSQDDRTKAEETLETMAAVMKDTPSVAYEVRSCTGNTTNTIKVWLKRPNLVRIESAGDLGGGTLIKDGTTMWLYYRDSNEYVKFPQAKVRPTLDNLLGVLFFEKVTGNRLDNVAEIRVTTEKSPEGELRVLSWKSDSMESLHWVDVKGALLRSRKTSSQGVVEETYGRIDLCPELAEDTFTFAPPKGAREIPTWEAGLLRVGWPAPDFEVTDLEGKTVRLSDFKGKTVLLNFWFLN